MRACGRHLGCVATLGLALAGCPDPSSIVPFPTDPCEHEGSVLGVTPCDGDGYAVEVCRDGVRAPLACDQEVACTFGAEGGSACGLNGLGTRARRCIYAKPEGAALTLCEPSAGNPACTPRWASFGRCVGDDVCRTGVSQRVACSDWASTRERTCIAGEWVDQPCESEGAQCRHGATDIPLPCDGATEGEFLTEAVYQPCLYGRLAGPTHCRQCGAGATQTIRCGLNGEEELALTCGDDGRWTAGCSDIDQCVHGATRPTACGVNGRGTRTQICSDTASPATFEYAGECVDADECADGAHRMTDTACAVGRALQRCLNGQWMELGCLPGCDETRPCLFGLCHRLFPEDAMGVCLEPSCDDRLQNGDETAADYGGTACGQSADETPCNGADDDGDGVIDEGGASPRSCGVGACVAPFVPLDPDDPCGAVECTPGLPSIGLPENGTDEDCDGDAEENTPGSEG